VRRPGQVTPRNSDTPVSAIDIAPTVLQAAGIERPAGTEGINLLDAQAVAGRPAIFGAVFTHNAVRIHDPASSLRYRWIVAGDWKLIVPDRRNTPDGLVELFDVAHDPGETRNLAGDQAARVADLMVRLDAWWPAPN
jgi:uncharacterized sulfatase